MFRTLFCFRLCLFVGAFLFLPWLNNVVEAAPKLSGFRLDRASVYGYGSGLYAYGQVCLTTGSPTKLETVQVSFHYGDTNQPTNLTRLSNLTLLVQGSGCGVINRHYLRMPSNVLRGQRYLFLKADAQGASVTSSPAPLTITAYPDLYVVYLADNPSSYFRGATGSLTIRVMNAGYSRFDGQADLRLYASSDSTITTRDFDLGHNLQFGNLKARSYSTYQTVKVKVPVNLLDGTRYWGAIVDPLNKIKEQSETNNTRNHGFSVVSLDLRMDSWSVPSSSPGYGSRVSVRFRVRNQGSLNARSFYVSFYYGASQSTSGLAYIGRYYVSSGLRANTLSGTITQSFALPRTTESGTRYLHYFVDYAGYVREEDETNNRGFKALRITGKPDLVMTSYYCRPTTQIAGGTLTLYYQVRNYGTVMARNVTLRFYESSNTTLDSSDAVLQTVTLKTPLQAGAYSNGSVRVNLPKGLRSGRRYVGVMADPDRKLAENNENNNLRWYAYTLTSAAPNLVFSSTFVPTTAAGAKSPLTLRFKVKNTGNANAAGYYVGFYLSTSATSRSSTQFIGRVLMPSLLAQSESKETSLTIPLPEWVVSGKMYLHALVDERSTVNESNEFDNVVVKAIQISGLPDLQVTSLTATPSQQKPGGQVVIRYTLSNRGMTRATPGFLTRFYESVDKTITTADRYLTVRSLTALNPGASFTGSFTYTLPAKWNGTTLYVGAIIDVTAVVKESLETNNTAVATVTLQAQNADLVMDAFSAPITAVGYGSKLVVAFRLKNIGTVDSRGFEVHFAYRDTTRSSPVLLGKKVYTGLPAGQTKSDSITLTLPGSVLYGSRLLTYHIDPKNTVPERNVTNNYGVRNLSITGRPDLKITSAVPTQSSQVPGGVVSLVTRLENVGKSRIPTWFYTRFYFSKDATISGADTYLTYLRTYTLNAGTATTSTVALKIPSTAVAGNAWVGALIDTDKRVSEANETNNSVAVKISIIRARAELYMHSLVASSQIQGAGDTITVLFNVRNSGRDLAQRFVVSFYYSDSTSRTGLLFLGKSREIKNLQAGGYSGYIGLALTFPKQLKSGTRYLHYFVDSQEQVSEANETNNRAYRAFSVLGKPDLKFSSLSVSPLAQGRGGQVTLSFNVENSGKASAGAFVIRFYYSTVPILTASAVDLGQEIKVSGLDALSAWPATGARKVTITIPTTLALGPGYLGAWVDVKNTVNESVEINNTRATAFRIVSPLPDLTVDSLTMTPAAAVVGSKVQFQAQIRNIGLRDAPTVRYSLYYSTDAQISTKDTLLGTFVLPLVARGQSVSLQQSVTLPATLSPGLGFVGLLVDPLQTLKEVDEANNLQSRTFGVMVDQDKDGYHWAPGCPAFVQSCDCNDKDKGIHPRSQEICDGKDNDCDGKIDPSPPCGCVSGKTRSCYSGSSGCTLQPDGSYQCTKPCVAGTQTCKGGQWGACTGQTLSQKEVCDGKDNDCDGTVDEGLTRLCYTGPPSSEGKGECQQGKQTCKVGQWGRCEGEVNPGKETCDGKDNDCDGKIDNIANSASPLQQFCASRCGRGVEYCFQGTWKNCDAPTQCEPSEPVSDAGPDVVPDVEDCYSKGCPKGQRCQKGRCLPDPCDGISCPSGEFCREGQCVKSCGCLTCPVGERCLDGECKASLCAGVSCPSGEFCNPTTGLCIKDRCATITCGSNRICRDGQCVDDPCASIQCPKGQSCRDGQCLSTPTQCQKEPADEPEPNNEVTADSEPNTEPGEPDQSDGDDASSRPDEPLVEVKNDEPSASDKKTGDFASSDVTQEVPEVPTTGCACSSSHDPVTGGFLLLLGLVLVRIRRHRRKRA